MFSSNDKGLIFESDNTALEENADMLSEHRAPSDCPIGWVALVRKLFKDIRKVCEKYDSGLPKVTQVKSKFGMLCFYLDYSPMIKESPAAIEVSELVDEAEKKSTSICEITGLPGSYCIKNKWYATLHEDKALELGYTKVFP